MTRVRVIGVGSPFGDDQVGWRVVNEITSSFVNELPPDVSLFVCDRPGSKLITHLEGAEVVVLVDAVKSNDSPGTVHRLEDTALFEQGSLASSHGLGVASALDLAKALGVCPANIVVYGVEIDDVALGTEMSAAVLAAVPVVARRIVTELHTWNDRTPIEGFLESVTFH
jgi:hydrogenase maturation protease